MEYSPRRISLAFPLGLCPLVSRNFDRVFGSTVDHPWWMMVFILALSSLAMLGYVAPEKLTRLFESPKTSPTESEAPPSRRPSRARTDVEAVRLDDSDVILVVESESLFTPSGSE